jgi:Protein of unknown function (DUF2971)
MNDHPVPPLLYHYTDAQGFKGIVKSRELWATHVQYLNDAHEYHYAVERAAHVLLERADASADPHERAILGRLEAATDLHRMVDRYVCVASFSAVGDDLSQWRGYCPNGAGYSLGFVPEDLVAEAAGQGFSLARCLYGEAEQRKAIIRALEEMRRSDPWTQALAHPRDRDANIAVMQAWVNAFAPLAPTIKHPAFRHEQEWRLISASISPGDSRWRVRPGRSMLIPYVPIALTCLASSLPIRKVVVGPTPHKELARWAVGLWLGPKTGSDPVTRQPVQVCNSVVPYRNW